MNFTTKIEVMRSKCIPDSENINFAGLGGAYIFKDEQLLLSIGTPTHISDIIDKLSQEKDSIFGKLFPLKLKNLKLEMKKLIIIFLVLVIEILKVLQNIKRKYFHWNMDLKAGMN